MLWAAIGVALLVLGGGVAYWRIRRRRQSRLISLVALLREPVSFDPAVLARVAGRCWNADLGDGTTEGADGFVAGMEVMNTIVHDNRMFLINSFPSAYIEDRDEAAQSIKDLRIRSLFCEHQAWFSCDVMGIDGTTPDEEVLECYRRLGKLFAELLDDNCLLIYLPDSGAAYPITEETETALKSQDPVGGLVETQNVPIVAVSSDDPLMKKAVEQARHAWPKFVAAYEAKDGRDFAVKAPLTGGDHIEFIWISVTAIEGDRIYGELANDPGNLGSLKLGSKVSVPVADLNDWGYFDSQGQFVGGFTIKAVQKASRRS